jgi:hypothetical protein
MQLSVESVLGIFPIVGGLLLLGISIARASVVEESLVEGKARKSSIGQKMTNLGSIVNNS